MPIFDDLEYWLHEQLPRISGKSPMAQVIRWALGRLWKARGYFDHGFLELDNNTAERAVIPVAIGRKSWIFAGSQSDGKPWPLPTPGLRRPSSTTLIYKLGSHGYWAASPTTIMRLDEMPWQFAAHAEQ